MIIHILMIIGGLAVISAGFWGTYNAKAPWNTVSSLVLPLGLITSIIGVLLLCVPDFFKG